MIILVGASASGKTEIAKLIIKKYGFKKMVTTTTRPMRFGEKQDIDYHFISKEEFIKRKDNHEFLETTLYNDNYYGTHKSDVGDDKILIVEVEGANAIYSELSNKVMIFYLEA
ncbi:MAG: guanylate kinase, partial [Bacilli bacterium]|nr:guanylate kinase [Bacilli bacterium]